MKKARKIIEELVPGAPAKTDPQIVWDIIEHGNHEDYEQMDAAFVAAGFQLLTTADVETIQPGDILFDLEMGATEGMSVVQPDGKTMKSMAFGHMDELGVCLDNPDERESISSEEDGWPYATVEGWKRYARDILGTTDYGSASIGVRRKSAPVKQDAPPPEQQTSSPAGKRTPPPDFGNERGA